LLSEKLGLPIFSVGELLREVPENSAFYQIIHEGMDKGSLVPNGVAAGIIREELEAEKYSDGFILDGWMRDMEQKDSFDPEVDYAVFINVSKETSVKRISGRRFCPKDGFSCNIYTLPPEHENHCDRCSGELVQREDDREEVVEARLSLFESDTKPVIEDFRRQGNLIEADGEGSPEEVLNLVLAALEKTKSDSN